MISRTLSQLEIFSSCTWHPFRNTILPQGAYRCWAIGSTIGIRSINQDGGLIDPSARALSQQMVLPWLRYQLPGCRKGVCPILRSWWTSKIAPLSIIDEAEIYACFDEEHMVFCYKTISLQLQQSRSEAVHNSTPLDSRLALLQTEHLKPRTTNYERNLLDPKVHWSFIWGIKFGSSIKTSFQAQRPTGWCEQNLTKHLRMMF